MTTGRGARLAVGFRQHTGWAAAVVVAPDGNGITLVDRRRVELCDPSLPGPLYHASMDLPLADARALVARVVASAHGCAEHVLAGLVAERGDLVAAGVPIGRPVPDSVEAILASHPLMHAAEGDLYREALAGAAESAGLALTRVAVRDVAAHLAAALGTTETAVDARLVAMGKEAGPPWRKDQREATALAWLAVASAPT